MLTLMLTLIVSSPVPTLEELIDLKGWLMGEFIHLWFMSANEVGKNLLRCHSKEIILKLNHNGVIP